MKRVAFLFTLSVFVSALAQTAQTGSIESSRREPPLRLASPFTDHAVLQRDMPATVRGRAQPGAKVEVSFAGQCKSAVADTNGKWSLLLDPMAASKEPRVLSAVSGGDKVEIRDVLVGDVYLASGQSNMEMPLWHADRKRFRDKMGGLLMQWPSNRNFRVMMTRSERGVSSVPREEYPVKWTVPTAKWLADNRFSALGYYFGKEVQAALDVPVGVIAASWGGTSIAPWVPDSGWASIADDPFVATNIVPRIATRLKAEKKRGWPEYPGDIFNEMVAPLAPYTCRGMIWYQGESDMDFNHAGQIAYSKEMRALADGWRREFGVADMPLLFVQLAQFAYPWYKISADDERLAEICDEQRRYAEADAHAWMACISDIGDVNDIHPCRKQEVAQRLAALAFEHVYGLDVKADAPQGVSATLVAPGKVEITLSNAEGLYRWMGEVSLWTERQKESSPIRFVAADGTVADCESVVTNGMIVASCDAIPVPRFVTHLRRRTDESNIYNASTLPLGTFKLEVKRASGAVRQLEPVSPVCGEIVPLLPDVQKTVLAIPSLDERIAYFKANKGDKNLHCGTLHRTSRPLVFRFRDPGNPQGPSWNGPWKVYIGKKPDLSDARVFVVWQDPDPGPNDGEAFDPKGVHKYLLEVNGANLEVGTRYYWKIACRRRCSLQCDPGHGCSRSKDYAETPVSEFVTEGLAPRWIALDGKEIFNVRDLGGRAGMKGMRVRQGMVYRGCTLNADSWTGDIPGKTRLTPDDIDYMRGTLGIKTDLDLRTTGETGGLDVSPLGKGVKYIHRPSQSYKWLFTDKDGGKAMAENFRVFCDKSNYPIYFHCSGGADRTGSLAWVLNAVLGVSRHETETDWEVTFYPDIPDANPGDWRGEHYFDEGFGKYGAADTPWDERIVLYLKSLGITEKEIETVRAILLEPATTP